MPPATANASESSTEIIYYAPACSSCVCRSSYGRSNSAGNSDVWAVQVNGSLHCHIVKKKITHTKEKVLVIGNENW